MMNQVVEWVTELLELDEARFLADFHQTVEKARQKAWHDRHIKTKSFVQGDQVLLYDSKYQKHPGKLQMHWLGPFIVVEIQRIWSCQTSTTKWYSSSRMGEWCTCLKPYISSQ
jgi:hypothetical protein